jgi:hypothetical protein
MGRFVKKFAIEKSDNVENCYTMFLYDHPDAMAVVECIGM